MTRKNLSFFGVAFFVVSGALCPSSIRSNINLADTLSDEQAHPSFLQQAVAYAQNSELIKSAGMGFIAGILVNRMPASSSIPDGTLVGTTLLYGQEPGRSTKGISFVVGYLVARNLFAERGSSARS